MPRIPSLFSHTTTIILVGSTLTMVQGDLRHISNRDAFNIENTVTDSEQQLPPTASLIVGNNGKVVS